MPFKGNWICEALIINGHNEVIIWENQKVPGMIQESDLENVLRGLVRRAWENRSETQAPYVPIKAIALGAYYKGMTRTFSNEDEPIFQLVYTYEEVLAIQRRLRANSWCFVGEKRRIYYDHLESRLRLWLRHIGQGTYLPGDIVLSHYVLAVVHAINWEKEEN